MAAETRREELQRRIKVLREMLDRLNAQPVHYGYDSSSHRAELARAQQELEAMG